MAGYARAAADLSLADERRGGRGDTADGARAAVPRLAAPDRAPLGGRARRGGVARRPRRAVAAGPGRPGRGDQPAAANRSWPAPAPTDRPRRPRVQQARGGRLPQLPAGRLPRPADRGARPGRGPRRAADRDRPGGRGDHRGREHLPGLPGRVRAAAADHRAGAIEGCPQSLLATWSLAVEYAHEMPPAGLAWPALAFASVLDTSGIPAAVLTSPAACGYITGQAETSAAAEQNLVSPPTPPCNGSGWRPSTRPAPRARSGCTPASGPRSAPTWRRAASTRWCRRRRPRCSRPGRAVAGRRRAQPGAAGLHRRAARLRGRPAVEAGGPPGAGPGRDVADSRRRCWRTPRSATGRRWRAPRGQLLGPGHAQSVFARGRLADAYAAAGRLAEALAATRGGAGRPRADAGARSTRRR